MKNLCLFLFLLSFKGFAFTLNTNINANFDSDEVKIWVTSNSTCSNAGISNYDLLDMAVDSVSKFWNRVPTSSLRIKKGGILQTSDSKFLTGILCVTDSSATCDDSTRIPAVNDIVIACNSDTTKNFLSDNYYALTIPNNFSGKKIKGSMIIINDSAGTRFNQLSRTEMINILGHEIGHAVGLGHTDDTAALMYHTDFSQRNRLGQDDIDGITYLHPNKLNGCSGIFGGLALKGQDPPDYRKFLFLFSIGILVSYLLFRIPKFFTYLLSRSRQFA